VKYNSFHVIAEVHTLAVKVHSQVSLIENFR
jgi:hypothetical protein